MSLRLGAVEGWVVTHDGETLKTFESDVEAFKWLHRRHSYSVDHAVRHEGYDVVLVRDGRVEWSYRRDALNPNLGAARPRRVKPKKWKWSKAERAAVMIQDILDPYLQFSQVVGSIRRRSPEVGDIELVVLPKDLEEFLDVLGESGFTGGDRKQVGYLGAGFPVELYIAHEPEELGGLVFMYTGDWQFNIAMRSKAKKLGLKLNQYGIWKGDKAVLQSEDEEAFFEFLNVRYHTPEERSLARRVKPKKSAAMKGFDWAGEEE